MNSNRLGQKSIDNILSQLNCSVDDLLVVLNKYKVKKQTNQVDPVKARLRCRKKPSNGKIIKVYRKLISKYKRIRHTTIDLKTPIRNQLKESIDLLRNKKKHEILSALPNFEEKESSYSFVDQIVKEIVNNATCEAEDLNKNIKIKNEKYEITDCNPEEIKSDKETVLSSEKEIPHEVFIDEPVAHYSKSPTIYLYPSSLFPPCKEEAPKKEPVEESPKLDLIHEILNNNKDETNESTHSEKGAAFVSDKLDEYLHEDSLLKISYEVPQLVAEKNSLADINDNTVVRAAPNWRRKSYFTSKKRRKCENTIKVKTVAEKRKFLEMTGLTSNPECISNVHTLKAGFLNYNKRTLRIPVRDDKKPTIHINFTHHRKLPKMYKLVPKLDKLMELSSRKRRLWRAAAENQNNVKIKYKPGPLSMKPKLQYGDSAKYWRTVIKKLPKIILELKPKIGKQFDPKIWHLLLPDRDYENLTEKRVEFALSVLVQKNKPPPSEKIELEPDYEKGQKGIIAKDKIKFVSTYVPDKPIITEEDVSVEVKIVVDNLLDYMERKEAEMTIIKEAEEYFDGNPRQTQNHKKKTCKLTKTELEAKRLNAKFIKVDKVNTNEERPCDESFCHLGCICSSLCSTQILPVHCGRIDCMFDCTCGFESTKLNAGMDLSVGTMKTLANVAKKNLAKEEKEFMQTVIQANDETIVVTAGDRERNRRCIKVPKKYDDSFISNELLKLLNDLQFCTDIEVLKKDAMTRKVMVKLERMDLSNIIPFCIIHYLHDCPCFIRLVNRAGMYKSTSSDIRSQQKPSTNTSLLNRFKINYQFRQYRASSARTRGVEKFEIGYLSSLRARNKTQAYLQEIIQKLSKEQNILIYKVKHADTDPSVSSKRKRKQQLEVREEFEVTEAKVPKLNNYLNMYQRNEPAMQRRKAKNRSKTITTTDIHSYDKLFEDAGIMNKIFSPNEFLKNHLLKILPTCPTIAEFRLVPWETLMKCYTTGILQFWYEENQISTKVIVTGTADRPSKKSVSFKLFEGVSCKFDLEIDIIHWIVNRKVPKNKVAENVVIILCFFDPYWEMCGIFEKVCPNNADANECLSAMFMPTSLNGHEYNIQDLNTRSECNDSANFYYTDIDDNEKTATFTLREFPLLNLKCYFDEMAAPFLRSIIKESFLDSDNKIIISVNLPISGEYCRWRILCLDANFTYLYLNRNAFSVQCKDLCALVKQSHAESKTIVLNCEYKGKQYPHPKFGIYASPNCKNAVFIGPYFINENHDYELLQYIDGDLINVDIIMPPEGESNLKKGFWFHNYSAPIDLEETNVEKPSIIKSRIKNLQQPETENRQSTIAVVEESNKPIKETATKNVGIKPKPKSVDIDVDNIQVDDVEETCNYDCDCIFITNVEELGYLKAYRSTCSRVIQVKLREGLIRYSTIQDAMKGIECKLLDTLIPVPSSFKLNVYYLPKEHVRRFKPLDMKYLKSHHLIGDFGILKLSDENLELVKSMAGLSRSEVNDIKLIHSAPYLKCKSQEFGQNFIATATLKRMEVTDIIQKAIEIIRNLQKTDQDMENVKRRLELEKVFHTKKLLNLMCTLPIEKQVIAKEEMKKILQMYLTARPITSANCDIDKPMIKPTHVEPMIKPTHIPEKPSFAFVNCDVKKLSPVPTNIEPPIIDLTLNDDDDDNNPLPPKNNTVFKPIILPKQNDTILMNTAKVIDPKTPPKLIRIKGNNEQMMILEGGTTKLNEIPIYNLIKCKKNEGVSKPKSVTINSIRQRVTDEIEITTTSKSVNPNFKPVVVNGTKGKTLQTDKTLVNLTSSKAVLIDSLGRPVPCPKLGETKMLKKSNLTFNPDGTVTFKKNVLSKDIMISADNKNEHGKLQVSATAKQCDSNKSVKDADKQADGTSSDEQNNLNIVVSKQPANTPGGQPMITFPTTSKFSRPPIMPKFLKNTILLDSSRQNVSKSVLLNSNVPQFIDSNSLLKLPNNVMPVLTPISSAQMKSEIAKTNSTTVTNSKSISVLKPRTLKHPENKVHYVLVKETGKKSSN